MKKKYLFQISLNYLFFESSSKWVKYPAKDKSYVLIRLDDMKKYIYLCWMQILAITFWYCKENEKRYRFQELIRVIERSSCYEMEIFNLLFDSLSVYGKDYLVIKLYDVLLKRD